jgi:hypothetical protein
MKRILNLRRHHYLAKFSIFWIMVALIVVMVGCEGEVTEYSLTMAVSPAGGGTTTPTGTSPYAASDSVNIQAVANPGYRFVNWSSAPAVTFSSSTDETTTFNMPDENVTVTANFAVFAGGNGTPGDPYQIADWYQLDNVRNYLDSYFILVNDLASTTPGYSELASSTAHGNKGWQPIGEGIGADCNPIAPFTGTFDGQGYKIRDLFINRPDENGVGLFFASLGLVRNVRVVNANVTGGWGVGILGGASTNVINCTSSGSVSGSDGVGGLIGGCIGSISESYSTASVSGGYAVSSCTLGVGGLVGENEGTISDCYAMGSVAGSGKVGGLVGWNYAGGTVERSYAAAIVTGTGNVGGLVGQNEGTVSNSFWDTDTSGHATSAGGTGRTTAEMTRMATFSGAGWSIIEVADRGIRDVAFIWNIANGAYAFLSWEP